jgi:hypothetical protein
VRPAVRVACNVRAGRCWVVLPEQRRREYAPEAARAHVRYAFTAPERRRIVATTHGNVASIAVMWKRDMRIERNPSRDPAWLQIVGILPRMPGDGPGRGA